MSNSSLVKYTKISPNRTSPRNHSIDTITIHCVVGQCSIETIGSIFASRSRQASSNYGIGPDGRVGMYVEEKDRSWCSSNAANDHRAITIEVASDTTHPYAITDAAFKALVELCADICKRNNIKELKWKGDKSLIGQISKQNMTVHRWFANKACPGDYIYNRLGIIAAEVNAKLNNSTTTTTKPTTDTEAKLYRVQTGAFRNKDYAIAMQEKLKAAGFAVCMVKVNSLYKIQCGAFKEETNAKNLAKKLEAAGYNTCITTVGGTAVSPTLKKTIDEIAGEILQGKWGNGTDRKNRLTKAGYSAAEIEAIQKRVNELL